MKTLSGTTRLIVIVTIGFVSTLGIVSLLQAESSKLKNKYRLHLVMKRASCKKADLDKALAARPKDSYSIKCDGSDAGGTLPDPCPVQTPSANKVNINATQQASFNTVKELRTFLDTAKIQ